MEELTTEPIGALPNPSYIARAANRLKKSSRPMLVELLHREAGLSLIQTRLVSQKKLKRHQRTIYRRLQGKIIGAWEDYSDSKITARQLLQTCSYINGPTRME